MILPSAKRPSASEGEFQANDFISWPSTFPVTELSSDEHKAIKKCESNLFGITFGVTHRASGTRQSSAVLLPVDFRYSEYGNLLASFTECGITRSGCNGSGCK